MTKLGPRKPVTPDPPRVVTSDHPDPSAPYSEQPKFEPPPSKAAPRSPDFLPARDLPKKSQGFRTGSISLGSWSQNASGNERRTSFGHDGRLRWALGRSSSQRRRKLFEGK
jgi:hypothetical protein